METTDVAPFSADAVVVKIRPLMDGNETMEYYDFMKFFVKIRPLMDGNQKFQHTNQRQKRS